jgi:hypothetical protein
VFSNAAGPGTVAGNLDAETIEFLANNTFRATYKNGVTSSGTWSVNTIDKTVTVVITCPSTSGGFTRKYTQAASSISFYFNQTVGDPPENVVTEYNYNKR